MPQDDLPPLALPLRILDRLRYNLALTFRGDFLKASSEQRAPRERRCEERVPGRNFRLLAPAGAHIVDCASRGLAIETSESLAVGKPTSIKIFLPGTELVVPGTVSWARLIGNRKIGDGELAPVYRAGISLSEGPSINLWGQLLSRLISPPSDRGNGRPQRKIVKWRRRRVRSRPTG